MPARLDALTGPRFQEEAYRVLRSNLIVALSELERPTVLITSSDANEGKTSTAVNLSYSLALAGRRVVLVDLDLRHPDIHRWVGLDNTVGVSDVLLDRQPVDACLQYVELQRDPRRPRGLYVMAAGPQVPDPAELLGSRRTAGLLTALAAEADIVLIDTPPVLLVADTLVIGRMTAGAVLVVEAGRTPVVAVEHAKDALTRNQTRILGVVLNKFNAKDSPEAGYGQYGYYGYGTPYGETGSDTADATDDAGRSSADEDATTPATLQQYRPT